MGGSIPPSAFLVAALMAPRPIASPTRGLPRLPEWVLPKVVHNSAAHWSHQAPGTLPVPLADLPSVEDMLPLADKYEASGNDFERAMQGIPRQWPAPPAALQSDEGMLPLTNKDDEEAPRMTSTQLVPLTEGNNEDA